MAALSAAYRHIRAVTSGNRMDRKRVRHSVDVTTGAGAFGLALLCAVASGCSGSESGSASRAPRSSSASPATSPVLSAAGDTEVAYPTA